MSDKYHAGYKKMYINGRLCDSTDGQRRAVICPGNEQEVAQIAWGGAADAQAALAAADAAFPAWAQLSLQERKGWMQRLAKEVEAERTTLQNAVMHEHGKPWDQANDEVNILLDSLNFYPDAMARLHADKLPDKEGTHEHQLRYEPLGVVVAYLAWNFPLLNVAFKIGPALAAGCTLIIKPASQTPLSAYVVGELCQRIGLPAGVVNIVAGPSNTVASTLSSSRIPRLLALIGSTETGRQVMNEGTTSVKRFGMELGGNAPVLVLPDADLDLAADKVTELKFANTGQICVAPNRVLVHQSIAQAFADKCVQRARKIKLGFGKDSGATMGPLSSAAARDRIAASVDDAVAHGAKILFGGKKPASLPQGYFYEPTVVANVTPAMKLAKEEIFGPVVSLITYDDVEAAVKLANETDAGLSSFIYGKNRAQVQSIAQRLHFGEVMINGFKYGIDLPHMGVKESGIGCDCSHLALHDYLGLKRITMTLQTTA